MLHFYILHSNTLLIVVIPSSGRVRSNIINCSFEKLVKRILPAALQMGVVIRQWLYADRTFRITAAHYKQQQKTNERRFNFLSIFL